MKEAVTELGKNIFSPTERMHDNLQKPNIDFSQLAPLVTAYQDGEVQKARIKAEADTNIAVMNNERQILFERETAKFDLIAMLLLFGACVGMIWYGMMKGDAGFITAGVSGFASYLAGRHAGRNPNKSPSV